MKEIKSENKVQKIDSRIPHTIEINPWEEIKIELKNAFGKSFQDVEAFEQFMSEANNEEKKAFNHPCTGPIKINTQKENIWLEIEIIDIIATRWYQCISKSTWFFKDQFHERNCEIFEVQDNKIFLHHWDIVLKAKPKLGFISTIDTEVRSVGRCSNNGWNIDLNYLDKWSKIYLPVNFKTPLIVIWDLHICEWNGEIAWMWIEADGEIIIKVNIVDKINFPIIDDKHRLIIVWWGTDAHESQKQWAENCFVYFKRLFPFCNWSEEDIYKFISAEWNIEIWNATGNIKTCWIIFHKNRILNKYWFSILH